MTTLVRIVAPHFVAAIEATEGRVTHTAPILAYMIGWDAQRVAGYVVGRGWSWERLSDA